MTQKKVWKTRPYGNVYTEKQFIDYLKSKPSGNIFIASKSIAGISYVFHLSDYEVDNVSYCLNFKKPKAITRNMYVAADYVLDNVRSINPIKSVIDQVSNRLEVTKRVEPSLYTNYVKVEDKLITAVSRKSVNNTKIDENSINELNRLLKSKGCIANAEDVSCKKEDQMENGVNRQAAKKENFTEKAYSVHSGDIILFNTLMYLLQVTSANLHFIAMDGISAHNKVFKRENYANIQDDLSKFLTVDVIKGYNWFPSSEYALSMKKKEE